MNLMDNYGEFELPDEKREIEVIKDPVKIILSHYELFRKIVEKDLEKNKYFNAENAYNSALKLFEGKETFDPSSDDVNKAINDATSKKSEDKNDEFLGFFISALHNSTNLETLVVKEYSQHYHGYRLKKDKLLVLKDGKNNSRGAYIGKYSEGNIINYGTLLQAGENAQDGIIINHSHIQFDCHNIKNLLAINTGTVHYSRYFYGEHKKPSLMNLGCTESYNLGFNIKVDIRNIPENLSDVPLYLKPKLDKTLKDIKYLQELKNADYKEQIKQYSSFNWNELEENIMQVGGMASFVKMTRSLEKMRRSLC